AGAGLVGHAAGQADHQRRRNSAMQRPPARATITRNPLPHHLSAPFGRQPRPRQRCPPAHGLVTTPAIPGLATRLAAPARLLAARLGHLARAPRRARSAPPPVPGAILGGRLHAPVLEASRESALWATTRAEHAALAAGGHWAELFAVLRRADRDRT